MKKRNIYQNRSQELFHLFEKAGNNSKVMCVPIDYAKKDHVVMFCNGYGDILRKPFNVDNTPEGVKYLIDQTTRSCWHRHIKKDHVFFGGEDVNSYAANFVYALRSKGWLVANVNAHDAKKQRANSSGQHGPDRFNGHCHHAIKQKGKLLPSPIRRLSKFADYRASSSKNSEDENRGPQ